MARTQRLVGECAGWSGIGLMAWGIRAWSVPLCFVFVGLALVVWGAWASWSAGTRNGERGTRN